MSETKTTVTVRIREEEASTAVEYEATVEVLEGETQGDAIARVVQALDEAGRKRAFGI